MASARHRVGAGYGVFLALVAGGLGLSCGAGEGGTGWGVACRSVEEVSRIAGVPGEVDEFYRLTGLLVDSAGTLYVLDADRHEVMALSPDGMLKWRRGREGSGPGEFRNPTHLGWAGDLLAVWDPGNYRFSLWTKEGESAGERFLGEIELPGHPVSAAMVGGTGRIVAPVLPSFNPAAAPARLDGAFVMATEGALDTLAAFGRSGPLRLTTTAGPVLVNPPYASFPSYAVSPEGAIAFTTGEAYVIDIHDAGGAKRTTIRGPAERPRPTDEHRRSYAQGLPDSSLVGRIEFPAYLPAVEAIGVASDGIILVKTYWAREGLVRWDRWSADGALIDAVLIPRGVGRVTGAGDRLHGIASDDLGRPFLVTYSIAAETACIGPG